MVKALNKVPERVREYWNARNKAQDETNRVAFQEEKTIKVDGKDTLCLVETNNAKSRRLMSLRVTKAVNAIELIEGLSSGAYSYTEEQVNSVRDALTMVTERAMNSFSPKSEDEEEDKSFIL